MSVSESRKKANKKWDSENMLTLSVRLRKEQVQQFRDIATKSGTNANTILKKFVLEYIQQHGDSSSDKDK